MGVFLLLLAHFPKYNGSTYSDSNNDGSDDGCLVSMTLEGQGSVELKDGVRGFMEVSEWSTAVLQRLVADFEETTGLRSSMRVYVRMDIVAVWKNGRAYFAINELERGTSTTMFLAPGQRSGNAFMTKFVEALNEQAAMGNDGPAIWG